MTQSEIYWLTRMDYLHGAAEALWAVAAVLIFALSFITGVGMSENETPIPHWKRWLACLLCLFLLGAAGVVFIPTTRELAAIVEAEKGGGE